MVNNKHERGNVRDVIDGTLYKKRAVNFHESDGNLLSYVTLMLSTDGAPVFKSVHLWLLLGRRLRYEIVHFH